MNRVTIGFKNNVILSTEPEGLRIVFINKHGKNDVVKIPYVAFEEIRNNKNEIINQDMLAF